MPSEPGPLVIIRPPDGRDAYVLPLAELTDHIRAARELRRMAFLDKMKKAGSVAADLEAYAEKQADALIARGEELQAKTDKAFLVHTKRMDAQYDALDGFEHALDALGNGAPETGSDASGTPYKGTAPGAK